MHALQRPDTGETNNEAACAGLRVILVLLAVLATGCIRDAEDLGVHLEVARTLLDRLGLETVDPPEVSESKQLRYVTATATAPGDQQAVVTSIADGLVADGWEILANHPLDAEGGPASEGSRVRARKRDLVVQFAVYDRIGVRPQPPGGRWVQLTLSPPNAPLSPEKEP